MKLYHLLKSMAPVFVKKYIWKLRKSKPVEPVGDGAVYARYCYTVFMRHIVHLFSNGLNKIPARVAEFGPGNSLGFGLCALLAGSSEYYAFDLVKYADNVRNLKILDELTALYMEKAPIPDNIEFPEVRPLLNDYSYPSRIFDDTVMEANLSRERVNSIRNALTGDDSGDIIIKYIVPWENYGPAYPRVDCVFSQAVLEHIDNLKRFYSVMRDILADGGFASHDIDFRSHGETYEWNGHWAVSDKKWEKIRGTRRFVINREPLSTHLRLFDESGFEIKSKIPHRTYDTGRPSMQKNKLVGRFVGLSDEDFQTPACYVIARKALGG